MRLLRVALVVLALALPSCSGRPPTIPEIRVRNTTAYDLDVEVTGRDRDGWLPLAIVVADSEKVVQAVTDQGEVWIFRFRHWGDPVGELSLTRDALERSGWRVEVPRSVGERLLDLGRPVLD